MKETTIGKLNLKVGISVDYDTAFICLDLVQLFLNTHPNETLDIYSDKCGEWDIQFTSRAAAEKMRKKEDGDGFYEGYNRAQRWTPVDEALPEESMFVVVTSKCGERLDRVISYYNGEEKQFVFNLPYLNYCEACVPDVVAWMPLPDPYMGGERE